jgi:hypothetical protein
MEDLEITIGGQQISVSDPAAIPISIDYALEDQENFQTKKGSQGADITVPATLINSVAAGSFHNPSVADLTKDETFKNPQDLVVRAHGNEIMVGKALLKRATHREMPISYTWNFYGDNTDWMIDLAEKTLYDFIVGIKSFIFSKQIIIDSWQYDGSSEALPYLFAPVRYTNPMGDPDANGVYDDYNMQPAYMQPSISKYWLIYWGFKSLGYRVQSGFMDLPFFRRQLMPWTWGAFLSSESTRLDNLRFLARSEDQVFIDWSFTGYWDLKADNSKTNGGFDNNGVYSYNHDTFEMQWAYLAQFNYGNLDAYLHLALEIDATVVGNGTADTADNHLWVEWYKIAAGTGIRSLLETDSVFELTSPKIGRRDFVQLVHLEKKVNVNPGDSVIAKVFIRNHNPGGIGRANIFAQVITFELDYFRIPIGTGTIDMANYTAFKNYKFLDYLKGIIDEFNMSVKTDVTNKVVLLEPTYPYRLPGETLVRPGFFNGDFQDWSQKLDLSQDADLELFSNYNQVINFRYRSDGNDSIQKIVQDRYTLTLGAALYKLPARFQSGNKDFENRFFSPVMHYEVAQWKDITGVKPQMICMISENSSNTSRNFQAQSNLNPKSAYYKGIISGIGWVFDGEVQSAFPYLFGVNYMAGGENDPVLSYSDERIGDPDTGRVAEGLLKKFYLQRLANIRNGQWHTAFFQLSNWDVAQPWHREFKCYMNQKWELIAIEGYKPLGQAATKCMLRKWTPVTAEDAASVYPSRTSLLNNTLMNTSDLKYSQLKGLWTDIPK